MNIHILLIIIKTISNYLFLNINQPDTLNFIISLFQASTCVNRLEVKTVLYNLWYHL